MHWFPILGSLKNLTTGLIWLVTTGDGGRRGEVAHGGWARGEMGGCTREQCGSNKVYFGLPSKPNNWSDLAGDEGGDGGRRGEVAHGGRARGEMGGGSNKRCTGSPFSVFFFGLPKKPNNWSDLAGDEGGGMGGGVGR